MGTSTVTCRLRDAEGHEFDHTFTVSNLRSDGNITEDEIRLIVPEILRQGLPPGTTLVRDEFILREGTEEGSNWLIRTFGSSDSRSMSGLAQFFKAPTYSILQLPTTVIRTEIPTLSVYDLPQVDRQGRPIPTMNVEDLPRVDARGRPIRTVNVEDLPRVDERGRLIRTINVEDLPRAPGSRPSTVDPSSPVASRASRRTRVRS